MTNNQLLKQLMKEYGLSHQLVSLATGKPVWKVDRWCMDPDTNAHIRISDGDLKTIVKLTGYIQQEMERARNL